MCPTRCGNLFSLVMVLAFASVAGWGAGPNPPAKAPPDAEASASTQPFAEDVSPFDSFVTPEEFLREALKNAPSRPENTPKWGSLTSQQKDAINKKYEEQFSHWEKRNGLRGKNVEWRLILDNVKKSGNEEGYRVKAIFLLTDGAFPNNNAVLKFIWKKNRSKDVHIFTYLYGEQDDEIIVNLMKEIAAETGGKYKNITK